MNYEKLINNESLNPIKLSCLNGNDVITAKISDHHPIIHDGVLFWNVMMQGKMRNGRNGVSYNNGFGLVESDENYVKRLHFIAQVIAEIIHHDPSISVIGLCEGPIQSEHVSMLIQFLKTHPSTNKFFINMAEESFYKPSIAGFPNWGLLMLADKNYKVKKVQCDILECHVLFEKLANRFQMWQLTKNGEVKYLALGHFPFGGDEHATRSDNLSTYGKIYCNLVKKLLKQYANDQFILSADFNLNPYLISERNDFAMDKITNNNSILFAKEEKSKEPTIKTVTVDGVLLSRQEKQKYYSLRANPGLFAYLKKEHNLFTSNVKSHVAEISQ